MKKIFLMLVKGIAFVGRTLSYALLVAMLLVSMVATDIEISMLLSLWINLISVVVLRYYGGKLAQTIGMTVVGYSWWLAVITYYAEFLSPAVCGMIAGVPSAIVFGAIVIEYLMSARRKMA